MSIRSAGLRSTRNEIVRNSATEIFSLSTIVLIVGWLSAFLPLVQPLSNIWIAETVFAVIIALVAMGFVQQNFRLNRSIPMFGLVIVIALVAAILGATLDASVNGGCFGYEVFATIVLTLPLLGLLFAGLSSKASE